MRELKKQAPQLILCALFTAVLLHDYGPHVMGRVWETLMGTAGPPFQFRPLAPYCIGEIFCLGKSIPWFSGGIHRSGHFFYLFAYFFMFRFLGGFLEEFFGQKKALVGLSLAFLALRHNEIWYFPFDVVGVILWTGLCYCIVAPAMPLEYIRFGKRISQFRVPRMVGWHFLFLISLFNRETAIMLLPAAFLVWGRTLGWRKSALHVGISGALWIAVRFAMMRHYSTEQLGIDLFWHNLGHFPFWRLAQTFGGLWILALWGAFALRPPFRALLLAVPLYAAAMLRYGVLTELRIWNELIVVLAPAMTAGLFSAVALFTKSDKPDRH